jgi:hypothetical protein
VLDLPLVGHNLLEVLGLLNVLQQRLDLILSLLDTQQLLVNPGQDLLENTKYLFLIRVKLSLEIKKLMHWNTNNAQQLLVNPSQYLQENTINFC